MKSGIAKRPDLGLKLKAADQQHSVLRLNLQQAAAKVFTLSSREWVEPGPLTA